MPFNGLHSPLLLSASAKMVGLCTSNDNSLQFIAEDIDTFRKMLGEDLAHDFIKHYHHKLY